MKPKMLLPLYKPNFQQFQTSDDFPCGGGEGEAGAEPGGGAGGPKYLGGLSLRP